jgi:hypothetical protein
VELPEIRVALRRVDLVRYAGAAGDFNPIHFSDHAAVALGLPGVIAHGMLTMGLAGRVVTRVLDDPGRLTKLGVRFTNPVLVPDNDTGTVCEFTGTVGQTEDADFHTIALKAASGSRQVLGQAKAVVRI